MHNGASRKCTELQSAINHLFADLSGRPNLCPPKHRKELTQKLAELRLKASELFDRIYHLEQTNDAVSDAAGTLCKQCQQRELDIQLLTHELERAKSELATQA